LNDGVSFFPTVEVTGLAVAMTVQPSSPRTQ